VYVLRFSGYGLLLLFLPQEVIESMIGEYHPSHRNFAIVKQPLNVVKGTCMSKKQLARYDSRTCCPVAVQSVSVAWVSHNQVNCRSAAGTKQSRHTDVNCTSYTVYDESQRHQILCEFMNKFKNASVRSQKEISVEWRPLSDLGSLQKWPV